MPPVKSIKNASKFLAIIDQQRAFLKRNGLPVELSDVSADITIVDSLSESTLEMELDSINTTIASGAMNALINTVTPGRTSTPKRSRPDAVDPSTTKKKKLKLSGAAVRDKVMAINDSDISSLETESDTQLILSSQD